MVSPYVFVGLKTANLPPNFLKVNVRTSKDRVIEAVCDVWTLTEKDIKGKRRRREEAEARKVICWLLVKKIGLSLKNTGKEIGGRDHTTVIHSIETFHNLYQTDETFRAKVELVLEKINL